jgi:hypothetical protein
MKGCLLSLALLALVGNVAMPQHAGSVFYGANLFPNGDFALSAGEYKIPAGGGPGSASIWHNWGNAEATQYAVTDPTDENNTVLAFKTYDGAGFSSMYAMLSIVSGETYDISFDYYAPNGTDNIGMAFWCTTDSNRLPEVNVLSSSDLTSAGATVTDKANGWKHVAWARTFDASKSYDSAHIWANVANGDLYLDNISAVSQTSGTNIFTGGDFEGFLDYAPSTIPETAGEDGLYGHNATLVKGGVSLTDGGYYGVITSLTEKTYQIDVSVKELTIASGTSLKFNFLDESGNSVSALDLIKDGVVDSAYQDGKYSAQLAGNASIAKIQLEYSGTTAVVIDGIVVRAAYTSSYDPSKTYYESKNYVVNGDFEKFEVGTKFSEDQLEGAWGSVTSYDNGARIAEDGGSKVAQIGKLDDTQTKTYSSMFLMTPDDISIGDIVRFRYDYKVTASDSFDSYAELNSCFVGGANVPYYKIDLTKLGRDETYTSTSGAEKTSYPIHTEALSNGYTRVTLDFEVTSDKVQWNSIRWLFTPHAVGDTLSIDNVELHFLSEAPFTTAVTKVEIAGGDVELSIGGTKQLSATVTPNDADDKAITWSSSNGTVASVSSTGLVTALAEGTAEIKAQTSNGVSGSIVVTVTKGEPVTPDDNKKGGLSVGAIIGIVIGAIVVVGLAVAIPLIIKKKKAK